MAFSLASPNGVVTASLYTDRQGRLTYTANFHDEQVVLPSSLGIRIENIDLGAGIKIQAPLVSTVNEQYTARGNDTKSLNHYVRYQYSIQHVATGRVFDLIFRVYDDGIAYRYFVPVKDGQKTSTQHVNGEASSWVMPSNAQTWFFERDSDWKLMSYAGWWTSADIKEMPTISKQGSVQGTPLVFQLPTGTYAVATKAALYDYSGMRLNSIGSNKFTANFTEGSRGFFVEGDVLTPWRVTLFSKSLNNLVNSDLIENLNPKPDPVLFSETSYIQPGRSVWSWMTMRLGTLQDQYDYVDKASELGFEYSLIDDGWKEWPTPWKTIAALSHYAKSKDVGIWVWVDSKDISDPTNDYAVMRAYLDKVKASGSVGVKTDFMNSEAKKFIDFEINFLKKSAARQLMVNFHGSHSSTGESRTYPNEMTREGIRGIEVNLHKNQHLPPSHNVTLPFTRFLVGHGDYTPIYYTNPGATTLTHQLATPIVFYSPVQIYAENPDLLMHHSEFKKGLKVLKSLPTVWDQTYVLDNSKLGEVAAFARRSGNTWYLAILNNETPRILDVELPFLRNKNYAVNIVEDDNTNDPISISGLNPIASKHLTKYNTAVRFRVKESVVSKGDTLNVNMAGGGGYVAVFTPIQ